MKQTNTFNQFALFCALFFISSSSFGQTLFNVQVNNFVFTPSDITIQVGDTVRWSNITGTHNVDGTTTTFPSNPTSFSNPSDGSGSWVFEVVFTTLGLHNYQCGIHGPNMSGTITVNPQANVEEIASGSFLIYPNPAKSSFTIENDMGIESVLIYSINGKLIMEMPGNSTKKLSIENKTFKAGAYMCVLEDLKGNITKHNLIIE